MEPRAARTIAERLHLDDHEDDGTPLIEHVARVARSVPADARAVAWLHEAFEWTAVAEHDLLIKGLSSDELRALRLLNHATDLRSDRHYLAHLQLIAHAAGSSGRLARIVKTADLQDRCMHPFVRRDGWSPPYARALRVLLAAGDDPYRGAIAGVG
jgi:hypothetical protein